MAQQRQPQRPQRERMEGAFGLQEERWTTAGPIRQPGPEERISELELNAQATVADAAPLGLAAFAASTFTLGAVAAGWGAITGAGPTGFSFLGTIPMLIIFGGIAQFVAAMWAFRKGDTFWATFLGVFGSLYATLGISFLLLGATNIPVGVLVPSVVEGVAVAMFAFIAAYLTWAAVRVSMVMVGVLGFLTAALALLSTALFVGGGFLVLMVAGYCAIASGLLAFYASAAIVVNSGYQREVLPY